MNKVNMISIFVITVGIFIAVISSKGIAQPEYIGTSACGEFNNGSVCEPSSIQEGDDCNEGDNNIHSCRPMHDEICEFKENTGKICSTKTISCESRLLTCQLRTVDNVKKYIYVKLGTPAPDPDRCHTYQKYTGSRNDDTCKKETAE